MTREKRSFLFISEILFFFFHSYEIHTEEEDDEELKWRRTTKKKKKWKKINENHTENVFHAIKKSWKAINLEFICCHKLTRVCRAVKHGRSIKIAKHAIFDSKSDTCDFHLFNFLTERKKKIMDLRIEWRQMKIFAFLSARGKLRQLVCVFIFPEKKKNEKNYDENNKKKTFQHFPVSNFYVVKQSLVHHKFSGVLFSPVFATFSRRMSCD